MGYSKQTVTQKLVRQGECIRIAASHTGQGRYPSNQDETNEDKDDMEDKDVVGGEENVEDEEEVVRDDDDEEEEEEDVLDDNEEKEGEEDEN